MAERMPCATMLSRREKRESMMASAVSTAWRVSTTRLSTVSESTTSCVACRCRCFTAAGYELALRRPPGR